ncbi:MAG: hypothetical protein QXH56_08660 [Thermoprotei archaeon]
MEDVYDYLPPHLISDAVIKYARCGFSKKNVIKYALSRAKAVEKYREMFGDSDVTRRFEDGLYRDSRLKRPAKLRRTS